ncbi:MAG: potassium channel family protein [Actinomycetota bacterium]
MRELFGRDADGESYRRVERLLEGPMLILSLLFIPVIVGPFVADLSPRSQDQLLATGVVLWVGFAIEFLWLLYLAPSRREMVRTHKLDLLVLLLPVLRPLQILRLAPAASAVRRTFRSVTEVVGRPGIPQYFLATLTAIGVGAWFGLLFERGQEGASLDDFGTALWWSFVTVTTVGYGDHFPVTGAGQVVAVVLMIVGIGGISLITASVAAVFIDDEVEEETDEIAARLDRIEALLRERTE